MTAICDCDGIGWPNGCRATGRCLCSDPCCNTGRWEDDGDGYTDFMPENPACRCTPDKTEGGDA